MNQGPIKKILVSAAALYFMLLCFTLTFPQQTSETGLQKESESQVAALSISLKDNLLSSQPVSAPSPSITIMKNRSSGNGFNNKFFFQAFLCNAGSVVSFFNFYQQKSTQCVWQPDRLHLAICVLRI